MTIRTYHHLDAGVPILVTGNSSIGAWSNFSAILKACLVSGVGSQPGAGWSLVDEGALYLVLRPASGVGYVTFVSCYTYTATATAYHGVRVYLSATYSGMASGVPQGEGVVTGQAAGNSTPHYYQFGNTWKSISAPYTGWLMVADENTFNLQLTGTYYSGASYVGASMETGGTVQGSAFIHCGLDSQGTLIAAGGTTAFPLTTVNYNVSYFRELEFTALRDPGTGLLVDTAGINARIQALRAGSGNPSTDFFSQSNLDIARVSWQANGAQAGRLRGVAIEPSVARSYAYVLKNIITGLDAPGYPEELVAKVASADGYLYSPVVAFRSSASLALFSNNPGLW